MSNIEHVLIRWWFPHGYQMSERILTGSPVAPAGVQVKSYIGEAGWGSYYCEIIDKDRNGIGDSLYPNLALAKEAAEISFHLNPADWEVLAVEEHIPLMRVQLTSRHSASKHIISATRGWDVEKIVELRITKLTGFPNRETCFLQYLDEKGREMLHHGELSVAHALSRAESDFCVKEDEWMVATS